MKKKKIISIIIVALLSLGIIIFPFIYNAKKSNAMTAYADVVSENDVVKNPNTPENLIPDGYFQDRTYGAGPFDLGINQNINNFWKIQTTGTQAIKYVELKENYGLIFNSILAASSSASLNSNISLTSGKTYTVTAKINETLKQYTINYSETMTDNTTMLFMDSKIYINLKISVTTGLTLTIGGIFGINDIYTLKGLKIEEGSTSTLKEDLGYLEAYYSLKESLYDDGYNAGLKDGYENGENAGYDAGLKDGYENGKNAGYDAGLLDGEKEGYNAGKIDGLTEASKQYAYGIFAQAKLSGLMIDGETKDIENLTIGIDFFESTKSISTESIRKLVSQYAQENDKASLSYDVTIDIEPFIFKNGLIQILSQPSPGITIRVKTVNNEVFELKRTNNELLNYSDLISEESITDKVKQILIHCNSSVEVVTLKYSSTDYTTGYNAGLTEGKISSLEEYEKGYDEGKELGYKQGFNKGVQSSNENFSAFSTFIPNILGSIVNFIFTVGNGAEIWGITALDVLSLILILAVLTKILKVST